MTTEDTATDNTQTDQQGNTDDANNTDNKAGDQAANTDDASQQENVEGAPEVYADFKLPEEVKLDGTMMEKFTGIAKGLNLPQDKAQELVDLGAEMAKGFGAQFEQSVADLKQKFADDLKNDTDLGGEAMEENVAIADKGLEAYGTEALRELLKDTGLDRHPEMVRVFHKIGKLVAEDADGGDGQGGQGQKSVAERMYGKASAA